MSPVGLAAEPNQSKRFLRDFLRLAGPYWRGPGQLRPRLLTALLGVLVLVQARNSA